MTPARASATTSCSSGSVPHDGLLADTSNGTFPNPIGTLPRRARRCSHGRRSRRPTPRVARSSPTPTKSSTSAAPAGARLAKNVAGLEVVRIERGVRACTEREPACVLPQVDRDDARRRQLAQKLDGDVPEPADADDHSGRAWAKSPQLGRDRVIRRQRRVGQRRGVHRVQVADRHEQPRRRDDDVLGQPAVEARARSLRRRGWGSGSPRRARTAGTRRSPRGRRREPRRPRRTRSRRRRARRTVPAVSWPSVNGSVHGRVPSGHSIRWRSEWQRPAAVDLDEDCARAGLGHLHLAQLGLRLPADELNRVHSAVDRDGVEQRGELQPRRLAPRGHVLRRDPVLRRLVRLQDLARDRLAVYLVGAVDEPRVACVAIELFERHVGRVAEPAV